MSPIFMHFVCGGETAFWSAGRTSARGIRRLAYTCCHDDRAVGLCWLCSCSPPVNVVVQLACDL
jgi:hypothetical protein